MFTFEVSEALREFQTNPDLLPAFDFQITPTKRGDGWLLHLTPIVEGFGPVKSRTTITNLKEIAGIYDLRRLVRALDTSPVPSTSVDYEFAPGIIPDGKGGYVANYTKNRRGTP